MKQILLIHGGMTFSNKKDYLKYLRKKEPRLEEKKRWSDEYLENKLPKFQIIRPKMPCKENAKYEEWKIVFENYINSLSDNLILIGKSLGAIFLVKYLSENTLQKKIKSLHLIAPPFDNSLPGEELTGGFELKKDLSLIQNQCNNIHFYFSKDDDVVPILHAKKYKKALPKSNYNIYESKNGHFQLEEFPEIVDIIKKMVKL